MGTLKTTIILQDKFSDQLNKINRSIQNTANNMNRLNNSNATSVNSINGALSRQITQQTTIMKQMGQWATKLRNIATIYFGIKGAIDAVNRTIQLSDKMTMNDAKLNIVAGGDKKLKGELEAKTFAAAQRSTTDYLEFSKAVGKLGILAGDKFKNNDSIVRFVELMNKSFQISGAEESERNAAMLQITQAIASNRLQGDEFRSILENAPMVMDALTKSLGVGQDKLKEMAKEGEITADVLIKAMFDAGSKIEEMYKQLDMTWERHWTKLKNVGIMAFKPIQEQFKRIFNSEKFQSFINGLCTAMIVLGNIVGWAFGTLLDLINWLVYSMNPLASLIRSLIAATVTYFVVTKLIAIATAIWGALTRAIKAAQAAQWGFNLIASANPIGLIIALVVLLIAAIYSAVAAVNHFADTSFSATGLVAAYFAMMGASIYNTFVYIWNIIASVAEFVVNVFKHPIYSVQKLFVNLASNVIDACIAMTKGWDDAANNFAKFMISAINLVIGAWNKFIDMLPETVVTKLGLSKGEKVTAEGISNVAGKLEGLKASLQASVANKPSDYWEAPKLNYKNLANVSKNWYNKGESLANKVSGVFENVLGDLTKVTLNGQKVTADALNGIGDDLGKLNDDLGGAGKNIGDTAKNTGDTAKNTSSSYEQDYSYLRNWAYQAGMGGSIGYEIKIEQNNRNSIASHLDIDKITKALIDEFVKGINGQAEVVR